MATTLPRAVIEVAYEAAAQDYLRSLPQEHFMEATAQGRQREITLASLAVLKTRRSDVQFFNELLVQYPRPRQRKPGQVVPDNMVILSDQPSRADSSYNLPLEPVPPFWMMEYVSKSNKRKDYEESFDKYERELKVPYYLTFYPDNQELTLYRHTGRKYVSVKPNEAGRPAVPELEVEVALENGWVRYWHQGELLPLPDELEWALTETKQQLRASQRLAEEQTRRAEEQTRKAESEAHRADELSHRAQSEARRADDLQRRLEEAERALAHSLRTSSEPAPRRANGSRQKA